MLIISKRPQRNFPFSGIFLCTAFSAVLPFPDTLRTIFSSILLLPYKVCISFYAAALLFFVLLCTFFLSCRKKYGCEKLLFLGRIYDNIAIQQLYQLMRCIGYNLFFIVSDIISSLFFACCRS